MAVVESSFKRLSRAFDFEDSCSDDNTAFGDFFDLAQ